MWEADYLSRDNDHVYNLINGELTRAQAVQYALQHKPSEYTLYKVTRYDNEQTS